MRDYFAFFGVKDRRARSGESGIPGLPEYAATGIVQFRAEGPGPAEDSLRSMGKHIRLRLPWGYMLRLFKYEVVVGDHAYSNAAALMEGFPAYLTRDESDIMRIRL